MDKTIVVQVERTLQHPRYGKTIRRRSKLYADDPKNTAGVGDRVLIMETRPMSKLKRWRLQRVVTKSRLIDVAAMRAAAKAEQQAKTTEKKK